MRRGFKKRAEETSDRIRRELGVGAVQPLPARDLALHLGVRVIAPSEIPGLDGAIAGHLTGDGAGEWSAVGLRFGANGGDIVLLNTAHSTARQESDIMHEIAHILCEHPPASPVDGEIFVRGYDPAQEDEARWLGACLQIPRKGMVWAVRRGMSDEEIAQHFGSSTALARFRRNTTGADRQVARERAR